MKRIPLFLSLTAYGLCAPNTATAGTDKDKTPNERPNIL